MRKIVIFLFYSFFLIIIGRNLSFIPQIHLETTSAPKDPEAIRQKIVDFTKTQDGAYSIFYEDLNTGETFGIHENSILTGASLNKLPIVGYLYNLASKKEIDLQEKIVLQKEDLQDYGTGNLRYEEPGQAYALQYLAQLTLQKSDNTAAHVLNIRLGDANVQSYAYQIGMNSISMADNDISARDVGKFYEVLYKNKIANAPLTKEVLGYMENTETEDRIPKYLPKGIHVYHKTGDAVTFVHDGGIIDDGKSPFILIVMSSNLKDEAKAKDTIGKIAKMIFDAHNGK
jgi:beta-lactamase class A